MKPTKTTLVFAATVCVALAANADPNWKGGGSTGEWSASANWTANDGNHFWIDPWQSASHFNMTFNRDGRTYAGDPEDKSDGNWDFYNIWEVDIRGLESDQIVTWSADGDNGPNVRSILAVGREATRGALAINSGKVTVDGQARLGWNDGTRGELTVKGGYFETRTGMFLAKNESWRGIFNLLGGTYKNTWQWYGNESGVSDDWAVFIRGNGDAQFHFDGGTIKAAGARQGYGVDGATFGPDGLKFDTDGNTVVLHETSNATIAPDATMLTKQGNGTLMVDSMPASGTVKVEGGTLKYATSGTRTLAHRWSFERDLTDSVTGRIAADATAENVTYANGAASLAGGDSGTSYIDLGADLWPSDAMTLEIWATYQERTSWARLFSWSGMYYALQDGGGWSKFELLGTGKGTKEATGCNIEAGSYCCYTFTFLPNGAGGTHIRMCRWDASTGRLMDSRDYDDDSSGGWLISNVTQEKFWLGRSDDPNNPDTKADYHEVRIWNGVFADSELREHVMLGPDTLPGENGKGNTLNDSASAEIVANDYLLHRWTFNNTLQDMVGGTMAQLKGAADFDSSRSAVRLPGGEKGTAWIDLGETCGFPTNDTPFTIELWHTMHEWYGWRRMFSMGKRPEGDDLNPNVNASMKSGLYAIFSDAMRETNEQGEVTKDYDKENQWWRLCVQGASSVSDTSNWGFFDGLGNEYHTMISVVPDGSGNCTITVFSENSRTGGEVGTVTITCTGWTPSDVNKIAGPMFNWLGHSHWGDGDPNATFNEVRIWNCAFTKDQAKVNRLLGPDKLPELTTINKTRAFAADVASGATLDLGGNAATLTTLTGLGTVVNDGGTTTLSGVISPGGDGPVGTLTLNGNVVVTGKIRLDEGDRLDINGTLDLSNATVEIAGGQLSNGFTFATATDGVTGTPTISKDGGWNERCSIKIKDGEVGTEAQIVCYGFMIIFR